MDSQLSFILTTGFFDFYREVIKIRISDVLTEGKNRGKKRIIPIILLISGLLSLILILVTVYGQYAGTYLINMTNEAARKGIALSESKEFNVEKTTLEFEPLNDVEDTAESFLNIEAAENTDGLYYEENQNYLAYTFYLKNTGVETVNVNYRIRITSEYRGLGDATFFKIRQYHMNNGVPILTGDNNYSKVISESDLIANITIDNLKPGDIKKFTFFVWLDGNYSDSSMLNGSIKFSWTFGILNAKGETDA